MNPLTCFPTILRLTVTLAAGSLAISTLARPYATSLTNSGSSISFRLNESADSVKIISNGGSVTNDLGPLPKGLTVTNLTVAGVFKIQVTKSSGSGYVQGVVNQISDDANNFVKFANQRGVAINKNTNSPYFGRIYASVATAGVVSSNQFNLGGRNVGEGIYLLNADQTDAVGQGDTPRTAGLFFDLNGTAGTESPYRVFVGPDDRLYISDWSASNGGLFVTDPNVATNSAATNVLFGIGGPTTVTNIHGSIYAAYVEGSLGVDLTVYVGDEDLAPLNSVWRYDIGSAEIPYNASPTLFFSFGITSASQVAKVLRGPDGKWYKSQRRADNATTSGIFVISSDGSTQLWTSLQAWRDFTGNPSANDVFFSEMRGIDVSPDGRFLAGMKANTNSLNILPLQDGIPNITNLIVIPTTPTTSIGRDVAFDAVGNLYTVSSGQGMLRIYSPGGFSIATTGSDGTFSLFVPQVDVSVAATDNFASESGSNAAEFTIARSSLDVSQPLTVRFQMTGTASNEVDYVLQTNSVTLTANAVIIPAGVSNVAVTLVVTDDSVAELTETATFNITPSPNYTVASSGATAAIVDNESPQLQIANSTSLMYEGLTYDYAIFRITRLGDTNAATLTVDFANIVASGTAISNVDYYLTNLPVSIDPGVINVSVTVLAPLDDALLEGNETVTLGIAAGSGYTAATNTGSVTITDDEVPTETVLFSDDFTTDSSANWTLYYANTNVALNPADYTAVFAFDYSAQGVPPAPHSSGDTLGLLTTVNKGGLFNAAGLNVYPNGRSFSNNFALRFDMYLMQNGSAGTTEYSIFGINHDGTHTNWFRDSTAGIGGTPSPSYDGLWCFVEVDGAALGTFNGNAPTGDYGLLSSNVATVAGITGPANLVSRTAATFAQTFHQPPWTAGSGAGAIGNTPTTATPSWAQVELSQIGKIITLKINNTVILSYSNTTAFTKGNIMLGYDDAFDSVGSGGGGLVFFDNVRVVSLPAGIQITNIVIVGNNAQIDFTWFENDPASAFKLQTAANVGGPYADDANAATTYSINVPAASYRITTPATNTARFLRIRHQ